MNKLVPSSKYNRQLKKLLKQQPQLAASLQSTYRLLARDITAPPLKLHKLQGSRNVWSVSVASNTRLIVTWEADKLYLLEIGGHDEVY